MSYILLTFLLLGSGSDTPASDPVDPVICKKYVETGSLVRKKKVCKTKSEWSKATSELNETMNRFVEDRRGRSTTGN